MKDSAARKSARQAGHRNKKPSSWPDYFDWMVRYARRRVGDRDARSVANDALFDAYRSDKPKPRVDDVSAVRRWLSCFITWRALRHLRREQACELWDSHDFDGHDEQVKFGATEHSECVLERLELLKVLDELSLEERTLLLAYHANGFTASELAEQKGVSVKSIRKQVEKAKASFVRAYERQQRNESRASTWSLSLMNMTKNVTLEHLVPLWRRFWNTMAPGLRLLALGSTCVALVATPGDVVASPATATLRVARVASSVEQEPEMRSRYLQMMDATGEANQEVPRKLGMAQKKIEPPVSRSPRDSSLQAMGAKVDVLPQEDMVEQPALLVPALQKAATTQSAAECSLALSEAVTAFRTLDDPRACLQHLNEIPADGIACAESIPRASLRVACQTRLNKK